MPAFRLLRPRLRPSGPSDLWSSLQRLAPLALLLCACELGNPTDGTDVGNPDLVATPARLALEATCPGGTARTSLLLHNESGWAVDAMAGGQKGEEAYPSVFTVEGEGYRELVAVIHVPAEAQKRAEGRLQVHHRRMADPLPEEQLLEIDWSAPVGSPQKKATVLCGEEIDCAQVDFGPIFTGATWQMPLQVVNDGCLPLTVEAVETEGGEAAVAGPALPATLQPGERWQGRLVLQPTAAGEKSGQVAIATDDPQRAMQRLGWRATVSP